MTTRISDQLAALEAAAQMSRVLGHLPGAYVDCSSITPGTVSVSLHYDLGHFEAWREALGIPQDAVQRSEYTPGRLSLTATGSYAGAHVELTGYAPVVAKEAPCAPST